MIHEMEDFECDTGIDVNLVQLFECRSDVVSGTEIFY